MRKAIFKFQTPAAPLALPEGTRRTGVLRFDPNGNNIYYNGDWSNYHNWHSGNIVLPFLQGSNYGSDYDWENQIRSNLDSWNEAGGFDWLGATDEQRKHRMLSEGTRTHQTSVVLNHPYLNEVIGKQRSLYNIPEGSYTEDWYDESGKHVGRNNTNIDSDFGIQTGNRRISIHVNTNPEETKKWDDFYLKLGYAGAYRYLDHWVPTRDLNRVTRKFGEYVNPEGKPEGNPNDPKHNTYGNHRDRYGIDWEKVGTTATKLFPALLEAGRVFNTLNTNKRIYKNAIAVTKPVYTTPYTTHHLVLGDEAGKQQYYRKAAQYESQAARPLTSDADRQMAYLMEAKAKADELRALGDILDNTMIQKTSALSKEHEDANAQRMNQAVNANLAEDRKTEAALATLKNGYLSAKGTILNNLMLGKEYSLKLYLANRKAIIDRQNDLAFQLRIADDPEYNRTYVEWRKARAESSDPYTDPVVKEKERAFKREQKRILAEQLNEWLNRNTWYDALLSAKSGTKLTSKTSTGDILYKTARDAVEHFRRMYKMTDDSRIKTLPKSERVKLVGHPKSKLLQGGIAPYLTFTPINLMLSQSAASETSSSKSSGGGGDGDSNNKKALDFIKGLIGNLEGLDSDNAVVQRMIQEMIGEVMDSGSEMSTSDLAYMYTNILSLVSRLKNAKELFTNANKIVHDKNAADSWAITVNGGIMVLDLETRKISEMSYDKYKENTDKYVPLTNSLLAMLRNYDNNQAFNFNIISTMENATSKKEIAEWIKENIYLGKLELSSAHIAKHEKEKIQRGLEALAEAPDGFYKITQSTKNPNIEKDINAAMSYLVNMMPKNMQTLLAIESDMRGVNPLNLLQTAVQGSSDSSVSFDVTPLTGKAGPTEDKSTGFGEVDGLDMEKVKTGPMYNLINGYGEPIRVNIRTANSNKQFSVNGNRIGTPSKVEKDLNLSDFLNKSGLQGICDANGITFGDIHVDPSIFNHILAEKDPGITRVILPFKIENGHKVVDLSMADLYNECDKEALKVNKNRKSKQYLQALAKELKKKGLDEFIGGNGLPDPNKVQAFAVVQGMTTDEKTGLKDKLQETKFAELTDAKTVEQQIIAGLTTDPKNPYELDIDDSWLEFGYDAVYRGNIFIPISSDANLAITADGNDTTGQNALMFDAAHLYNDRQNSLYEQKKKSYKSDNKFN